MAKLLSAALLSLQVKDEQFEIEPIRGRTLAVNIVGVTHDHVRDAIRNARFKAGIIPDDSAAKDALRFIGPPAKMRKFVEVLTKNRLVSSSHSDAVKERLGMASHETGRGR